jgi:UDP-N-acetyl-2-amino-2-deoxyglucuronate dehydrogenase
MIKFAIIGCGRISQRHAGHIINKGKLIACIDVIDEKAKSFGKDFNCKSFSNFDLFFKYIKARVDVVSICTPNGLHFIHTTKSLLNGHHVLCEKPMALSSADAGEMIRIAESVNKRLFIVKQNRFNPPVEKIKKIISENKLGDIFSIQLSCFWNRDDNYYKNSWKGTKKLDGGILYTQFSHFLDLLYWIVGDVKETYSFSNNFSHQKSIEFEDTIVSIVRFKDGVVGTINSTINSYNKNMEGSLTIFAEKGTVKIGGQYLNELEYQEIKSGKITKLPKGNSANNYGTYVGSMSNHDKIYDNLINVLENNAEISTSGFEGFKTVEIIEKIYNSIR